MINNLKNGYPYTVQEQGGFFHVQSQNYQMPSFENMVRVYINCKNENIAGLARYTFG